MATVARVFPFVMALGFAGSAFGQVVPEAGPQVTIEIGIVEVEGVKPLPPSAAAETPEQTLVRLQQFEKEGKTSTVTRFRLATLNEQTATVQTGENVAVPSGQNAFGRGMQTVYQLQQFGTMIGVTPRLEADGKILMELRAERTRLGKGAAEMGSAGEEGLPRMVVPPSTETFTVKTTVRAADGVTLVAHSTEEPSAEGATLRAILVTARVRPPG